MPEGSPEHGLHVDDGLGVGHVVLLGAHGALLVHHHQVVGVDDPTLEEVVQTARQHKQQSGPHTHSASHKHSYDHHDRRPRLQPVLNRQV